MVNQKSDILQFVNKNNFQKQFTSNCRKILFQFTKKLRFRLKTKRNLNCNPKHQFFINANKKDHANSNFKSNLSKFSISDIVRNGGTTLPIRRNESRAYSKNRTCRLRSFGIGIPVFVRRFFLRCRTLRFVFGNTFFIQKNEFPAFRSCR